MTTQPLILAAVAFLVAVVGVMLAAALWFTAATLRGMSDAARGESDDDNERSKPTEFEAKEQQEQI